MVVVETKGCELAWLVAKEMWEGGCQSFVAILRGKVDDGRERRALTRGVMERPWGTGREPFCEWWWWVSGWLYFLPLFLFWGYFGVGILWWMDGYGYSH